VSKTEQTIPSSKGESSSRPGRKETRLYLVNPDNPVVSLNKVHWNRLNKYRVWKPLGLLVVAGLTPPDWEVTLIDENLGHRDYGTSAQT
jgi:hypothetical protein